LITGNRRRRTELLLLLKVALIVRQEVQQLNLTSGKIPDNYYLFYEMFEPDTF